MNKEFMPVSPERAMMQSIIDVGWKSLPFSYQQKNQKSTLSG